MDKQDEAFLLNTGLARKRVRVVQLLVVGLAGLLVGWLGNFMVAHSCYFAASEVAVGSNGQVVELRYGLWRYSPVDAAVTGYAYCYPYNARQGNRHETPVAARVANVVALALGTYSLVVLWVYLVTGHAAYGHWRAAVYSAYVAGAAQLLTLLFFAGALCRERACSMGPGSALAVVTAVAWCVFGWELHYNRPIPIPDPDDEQNNTVSTAPCSEKSVMVPVGDAVAGGAAVAGGGSNTSTSAAGVEDGGGESRSTAAGTTAAVVSTLEMADFQGASQEYLGRFHRNNGTNGPRGSYQPPSIL